MNEYPDPPMKRLRFELTIDAHDLDDLHHEVRVLINDLHHEVRETREQIGGTYRFTLTQRSDLTPEEYHDDLAAWMKARRTEEPTP